jgi:hypothetical protein
MESCNENKSTHESEEKKNVGELKAEVVRENSCTSLDNWELGSDVHGDGEFLDGKTIQPTNKGSDDDCDGEFLDGKTIQPINKGLVVKLFESRGIGTNDGPVPYDKNFTPHVARKILGIEPDNEYCPKDNSISDRRKKPPIIEEDSAPSGTCCCPTSFEEFREMFTSLGFCGNKPL